MRIDKFLSDMGIATRKEIKDSAKRGGVLIDGIAVKDVSMHIDPEKVTVSYLGKTIEYKKYVYVMLNKPEGYVSATEDSRLPVVTELLADDLQKRGLFPVGRLDRDTTGLMILTDNGKMSHALLSPRGHVKKVYSFSSADPMRAGVENEFRDGVTLGDGYECKSADIVMDEARTSGYITLTEGKYHQIKRMVASTGNKVTRLERISFGGVELDSSLERGEWRYLTDEEIKKLTDALCV